MKLLIIGGSGHVSGTLAIKAIEAGHDVWALTRGTRPLPDGVKGITVDRKDREATTLAFADTDTIWDLVVDCICFDLADIQQDIELFKERAEQFVMISTDFVYDPEFRTFPQTNSNDHFVNPDSETMAYGANKRLCELELLNCDTGNMKWTVLRPGHIYGPRSALGCLPTHGRDQELISKMKAGEPLKLVGGGYFLQQPILADDLVKTILSIYGNDSIKGKIYNITGPDVIESKHYYTIIADVLGVSLAIEEIPVDSYKTEHPEHVPFLCHRIYDISDLKDSGLSVPSTPIADGLQYHVEGLLEQ
ncbi:NAD-dependent epimerase/dehydratase family protein [bacterium AH-315-E10]|nr:NAD-dependent epimerase/dehydratase family protein [bacterium AH-315-E10]